MTMMCGETLWYSVTRSDAAVLDDYALTTMTTMSLSFLMTAAVILGDVIKSTVTKKAKVVWRSLRRNHCASRTVRL